MTKPLDAFLGTWKIATLAGALAIGAALSPMLAQAQDAPAFSDVDQNVDGVISEEEFMAAWPDMTADAFATADVNGDSVLDQPEYEAMVATMP